ncbi:MAG: SdrD B-like domain-containing protein [Gemmataceae bacterium]
MAQVSASDQFDPDSTPGNNDPTEDDQATATIGGQQIDLSLTKVVDNARPNVGQNVTFTIILRNAGPDAATNVAVADLLPAGLQFVSSNPSQGSYNSATGLWTIGTVASGGSATLQVVARVTTVGAKTNVAQVSQSDQFDPDSTPNNNVPTEDDQSNATVTPPIADLRLAKSVDNAAPNVGGIVTFTLALVNDGPNGATGVAVADTLPAGLQFVSATASQGSYDAAAGVWTIGAVANGAGATLQIQARVMLPGAITNMAQVSASDQFDPDSTPGNNDPTEDDQATATIGGQQIDLSLTKVVDNARPNVGQNVTFTIILRNDGPSGATGVAVRDQLPAGLTFVSAVASQGSYNAATGVWTIGNVAVNGTCTLTVVATVTSAGAKINTAQVSAADQPDVDSTPNNSNPAEDDQASVTVTPPVIDLSLVKSVDRATANVGDTVTFTIALANAGPDGATGVSVADVLPAGLTFVSATATQGSFDAGTGIWTIGGVASGSGASLSIVARVTTAGLKTNIAQVQSATEFDIDSTPGNSNPTEDDQSSATVTGQQIDLSLTKIVDNAAPNVGDVVTFTLALANAGPSAATGVAVRDPLPAGLAFISAAGSQGNYDAASGVWTVGGLAINGTATLAIRARVTTAGTIVNVAQISAADQPDVDSTPNNNVPTEDDQAQVSLSGQQADLSLTKTVNNARPNVGDVVTFTLTLSNAGPSGATGVAVTDALPAGLQFVSATPSQGSYSSVSGVWAVGNMANGGTATLQIAARVTTPGAKSNVAEVTTSDQPDPDSTPGNGDPREDDRDTATVTPQVANLSLTKTVDNATPILGTNVNFTVTLRNDGPDGATNVAVRDVLPAGLTFVSANASQGSYSNGTGIWTIGNVANGGTATLQVVATAATLGVKVNGAEVSASDQYDIDSTPGNASTTEDDDDTAAVTPRELADLSLTKTVDNGQPNVGDSVTFTVTLANAGPNTATGVIVTDALPAGLQFLSASASQGGYNALTGLWSVGTVANGGSATLQVVARVLTAGVKVNVAEVTTSDQPDPDSTPNNGDPREDDRASVPVTGQQIDLSLTKVVDNARPNVGQNVTFTIILRNDGPSGATGVAVRDQLPAGLAFVSAFASQGSYNAATGGWTIGSVAVNGTATLTVVATVTVPGAKTNTAQVSAADQPDVDSTPNNSVPTEDDQASAIVDPPVIDLSLTKSVDRATANVGDTVTFTVAIANAGPDGATGVSVADVLPAGLAFVSANASQGGFDSTTGVWTIGNVASGAGATLSIVARVTTPGIKTNVAQVQTANEYDIDSTPGNNVVTEDDQANASVTGLQIDLSLTKTIDNAAPNVGDVVTFTVGLANAGPSAATGVAVSDPLPAGLTFVSAAGSQGSYDATTGVWAVGNVAVNGSATLTIQARVIRPGTITNLAQVSAANEPDVDSTPNNGIPTEDDQGQVSLDGRQIDLSLTKTIDNAVPSVGSNVTFTLTLRNAGPSGATGVAVRDVLPGGLTFVSASASQGRFDAATGIWTVGSVGVNGSATLQIVATLTQAGVRTNTAEVSAANEPDIDSTPGNGIMTEDDQASAGLQTLSLGNRVWDDLNNDGRRQLSESGVANVTVRLYTAGGTLIASTTTDANGHYLFTGLGTGSYYVEIDPPAGYISSSGINGSATGPFEAAPGANDNSDDVDDGTTNGSVIRSGIIDLAAGSEPTGEGDVANPDPDTATPDANSNLTLDFGIYRPASVGDRVFLDANANGIQDVGELGVAGVNVRLLDGAGTLIASATSDANGLYGFTNLAPGQYIVEFAPPAGYVISPPDRGTDDTADSDINPATGRTTTFALAAGQSDPTRDAGLYQLARVGDFVWEDRNGNGLQDAGEPGLANVTVRLLDGTGAVVGTTTTNANGAYRFDNLTPATYQVEFALPTGYVLTARDAGTDDATDSDADPVTGRTGPFVLTTGQDDSSRDAGLYPVNTLCGFVYVDANNNGVRDPGESPIAGVRIALTGSDDRGQPVDLTATTASDGSYCFTNLQPGTYAVREGQPRQYLDGTDAAGTPFGGTSGNDVIDAIVVPAGTNQAGSEYNFGELVPATISGSVFIDQNRDGIRNAGEPGIAGTIVTLTGTDDRGVSVTKTFVTGPDGGYAFTNLRPGAYRLHEQQPAGFADGGDAVGTQGGTGGNDIFSELVLAAGQSGTTNTFGELPISPPAINKGQFFTSTGAGVGTATTTSQMATSPSFANAGTNVPPVNGIAPPVGANRTAPKRVLAVAADEGGGPIVRVFDFAAATEKFAVMAYDPAFRGGVRVATGDIDGDGVEDVVTAAGAGGGPHIRIFSGVSGALIAEWMAYGANFTGGVYVAAADLDGDGRAEVITGAGEGGGPHVRAFKVNGGTVAEFANLMAYSPAFLGGVRVAAGDLDGDGLAEIVTGAGTGGAAHVRVFTANGVVSAEWLAYAAAFRGGVFVAVGDADGDGRADVITGAGAGGGAHVRVFAGDGRSLGMDYLAYDGFTGGVRVAAVDIDGDGRAEIATTPGSKLAAFVRAADAVRGLTLESFAAFDPTFTGGAYAG